MKEPTPATIEIQTPTPGRVVLYAPDKDAASVMSQAQLGADDPALRVFPGTVLKHDGEGKIRLAVAGFSGVFSAPHGERAPGEPETGCWTWPVVSRETAPTQVKVRSKG